MVALNLPVHRYGYVHRAVLAQELRRDWEPAIWFGLLLDPTEAPLLTVLLECGAIYRRVPPHAWRFGTAPPSEATFPMEPLEAASRYNALGRDAVAIEYTTLRGLAVQVIPEYWPGTYLWTLEFYGDSYSRDPGQSKALHALALDDGRLTFQPGHHVLCADPSFTRVARMPPTWLRRSLQTWAVQEPEE